MASSLTIIHFGRKPEKGGIPARESRIRGMRTKKAGVLVHEVARRLIVKILLICSTRMAAALIRQYVTNVMNARVGENCITTVIQPM